MNKVILVDKINKVINGGYIINGVTCITDTAYKINDYVVINGYYCNKEVIVTDSHSLGYPDNYNDIFLDGVLVGITKAKNRECLIKIDTDGIVNEVLCKGSNYNIIYNLPLNIKLRVSGKIIKDSIKAELMEIII